MEVSSTGPPLDFGARGVGPQSRRLLPAGRNSGVVAEGGPYPRQLSQEDMEASVHRSGSDRYG